MKKVFIFAAISSLCLLACSMNKNAADIDYLNAVSANETDGINQLAMLMPESAFVEQIVYANANASYEIVDGLMSEYRHQYPETADKMQAILECWNNVNDNEFVNPDILPGDLPNDRSLCIVTLGFQLNPDGSMRDELIGRLTTVYNCWEKYPESYVLVTGGGTASENPAATEADMMAEWLIENGIPKEQIIVENKSMTTTQNAKFSYEILSNDYSEVTNVAIVTSDYHVPLGVLLFQTQFILAGDDNINVVSNAGYMLNNGSYFSPSSQANNILGMYKLNGIE